MTAPFDRLAAALADHYRIEKEIGSGGMATVYLAQDLKHDRQVAVKVLRPELAATLGPDRFPREIRILAKLQHPHVLPLLDSGESTGFLYYVMPYVDGESLRQKIERDGPMPVHEAVRVLREVADALAYAHAHHVLHRDIKPDNVMLSGRHALVTDFGVAKAVSDAGGEKLTTVGIAVGTPTYMSPEQATGDVNTDHRSDIYALGILGYEMLSGKPPFVASTAQAVLSAQVLERPKPVTERRAAVPEVLSDLLLKCLEKDPADRWQSADEVVHALEALGTPSGGVTPTNTRPLRATDARRPAPKRRWLIGAAAGGVVLLAAAGIAVVASGESSIAPNHIAVLPIQDISGSDGQFVDAMHDQLIISLGQAGGLTVAPRSAMMIYRTQPKPMNEVARELKVGAILEGTVFRTGDQMRINVQLTEPRSIRQLWSHSYQINVRDVLGAQDSVVRQIAAGIRQAVTAPTPSSP
jgi:serine/threonine-protein kinase